MNLYRQNAILEELATISPMGESGGFLVRPGLFDVNGAMSMPVGINFTIHTHGGTSCQRLNWPMRATRPAAGAKVRKAVPPPHMCAPRCW